MYLENLAHNEMERIAYLTGDTMAAAAFGSADEAQDRIDELETQLEESEQENARLQTGIDKADDSSDAGNTRDLYESALETIATCYQNPCKPTRKQLDAMARTILEITACPGDFDASSARLAIYAAFGHAVGASA